MREQCMCGASDCVACRGPSAKYATWCGECPYVEGETGEGCTADPGSDDCQRKCDADNAEVDAYESRMEARADRIRDERGY
jgi:hypothetical protein